MIEKKVVKSPKGVRFILFKKGDIVHVKTGVLEIMYETSDDIIDGDEIAPLPVRGSEVSRSIRGNTPIGDFKPVVFDDQRRYITEVATIKGISYRWKRSAPTEALLREYERAVTI
jgi:hypothetical protein